MAVGRLTLTSYAADEDSDNGVATRTARYLDHEVAASPDRNFKTVALLFISFRRARYTVVENDRAIAILLPINISLPFNIRTECALNAYRCVNNDL